MCQALNPEDPVSSTASNSIYQHPYTVAGELPQDKPQKQGTELLEEFQTAVFDHDTFDEPREENREPYMVHDPDRAYDESDGMERPP